MHTFSMPSSHIVMQLPTMSILQWSRRWLNWWISTLGLGFLFPCLFLTTTTRLHALITSRLVPPQTIIANTTNSKADLIEAAAHSDLNLDTPFEWEEEEEEDTDGEDLSENESGKSGDMDGGEDENSDTTP